MGFLHLLIYRALGLTRTREGTVVPGPAACPRACRDTSPAVRGARWDHYGNRVANMEPLGRQQSETNQAHLREERNEAEVEAGGGPQMLTIEGPGDGALGQPDTAKGTWEKGSEIVDESAEEREQVDVIETVKDDEVKEMSLISSSEVASQEMQVSKSEETSIFEKQSEMSRNIEEEEKRDGIQVTISMVDSEETTETDWKTTSPLPSNGSYSDREKEESLPIFSEDLSRDDTSVEEQFTNGPPTFVPGTPERGVMPLVEVTDQQDEEDERKRINRTKLELKYKELLDEQERLNNYNNQIQNKLAVYYKKKADESKIELKKPQADYDQRYAKFMELLAEVQVTYKKELALSKERISDLTEKCEDQQQLTDNSWKMFQSRKKVTAKTSINKRPGRQAALQELERIQQVEEQKEQEMRHIRFLSIKMKNKLKYYEQQLKAKEELADGLNLIDYEQLKIENQSYSEKIEERKEEVTKMKKKIAGKIEVLTHIKEKLEYMERENKEKKTQLREVEAFVAQKRKVLTKMKQARDKVRSANLKLKQECGLLCNKLLLRDLEDHVDTNERLQHQLEQLKRRHANLTLDAYGIKKKIEWVKTGQLQTQ
ncbi:cilia- and flagella-associated protein 184 [Narcine bancroftii]|uniref:cilia- and flagella-associated protein 184 n=1 Tax=Narcine bancroftii TaxID=1343680 RepID=UPI003831F5CC